MGLLVDFLELCMIQNLKKVRGLGHLQQEDVVCFRRSCWCRMTPSELQVLA